MGFYLYETVKEAAHVPQRMDASLAGFPTCQRGEMRRWLTFGYCCRLVVEADAMVGQHLSTVQYSSRSWSFLVREGSVQ